MPDALVTEAGGRLLQETGDAVLVEAFAFGDATVTRGAPVGVTIRGGLPRTVVVTVPPRPPVTRGRR